MLELRTVFLRQLFKNRVISIFVYPVDNELEIVEIGSSISETRRFEPRMVLSSSNGVKVDFMVRSTEDGLRSKQKRIGAASNEEPNSVERHYLPSLH
ncbi:hypothetical protein PUN28_011547 [Cardiocondyla obscurior]|uniref:Uncharacterized protein n=1 Tax=Cardiocondyla obscurior TaxID=286306 RepID=A0AAW2FES7_9HYME